MFGIYYGNSALSSVLFERVCVHPVVISGSDEIELLSPVNKLTGRRDSPLRILQSVALDANSRALADVLQELPQIMSDPNLSDDDRFDFIESRLATGTDAENTMVRDRLAIVAKDLFESLRQSESSESVESSESASVS